MVVVVVSFDEGGVGRNGRVVGCVERSAAESSAGGTTPARKRRARPGFRARTDARCCCAHSSRRQSGNANGVGSACGMRRSRRCLRSCTPIADARGSSGSDLQGLRTGHSPGAAWLKTPSWTPPADGTAADKVSGWGSVVMVGMFVSACRYGHDNRICNDGIRRIDTDARVWTRRTWMPVWCVVAVIGDKVDVGDGIKDMDGVDVGVGVGVGVGG
ncbi:uncharacterized protein M6B38_277645 [Iris pallida]|uniref:Uncharacterized protein n=1 Tax=Iris pallida TaxID=29817 RepID=A0AAX6I3R7_IRIPA|nr:uncharacterized protein M6B38_277645 [Iris pallida]